jgi:hypothetical protein
MSRDVKLSNQWSASMEFCVKRKLWLFVPSGLMLCVLLRFVGDSVLPGLGVCYTELTEAAWAGSSLADFSALKMEAMCSSETSVYTRSTRCHIPEDGILHSHRRENLKSYLYITVVCACSEWTTQMRYSIQQGMQTAIWNTFCRR